MKINRNGDIDLSKSFEDQYDYMPHTLSDNKIPTSRNQQPTLLKPTTSMAYDLDTQAPIELHQ